MYPYDNYIDDDNNPNPDPVKQEEKIIGIEVPEAPYIPETTKKILTTVQDKFRELDKIEILKISLLAILVISSIVIICQHAKIAKLLIK